MTADDVTPGSRWYAPLSGRTVVIQEVAGRQARWSYTDDPEDGCWDDRGEIAEYFRPGDGTR